MCQRQSDDYKFNFVRREAREREREMVRNVCALCILKSVGDLCLRVEFKISHWPTRRADFADAVSSRLSRSMRAHAGGSRDAERADIKSDRESLWDNYEVAEHSYIRRT